MKFSVSDNDLVSEQSVGYDVKFDAESSIISFLDSKICLAISSF